MRSHGVTDTHFHHCRLLALLAVASVLVFNGPRVFQAQEPASQETQVQDDTFDPVQAYNDMKIGDFYFKKGRYDAAIARYRDAARHRPGFAVPYLSIAKAYEKKHEPKGAIEAYEKYLEILPKGSDAPYAKKQIEKLKQEKGS
ncbi:MAG: tetratricopeptide repeat protein [Acidobacteriia bacterium]|nr:tetratricopeptide repeat protein [Terriglobia bacterium]